MTPEPPIVDADVESFYRMGLEEPILQGIRWTITRGEHWALIGENGSGKSSLLSIISGAIWPSRGVVHVLGHQYGRVDKRELRKRIGVVTVGLYAEFPPGDTALEVAASGLGAMIGRLGPTSTEELARAAASLARVRATEVGPKAYGVLSQGERQRVMIARALINEPDLLIFDEPCAGLDPVARERLFDDLAALATEPDGPTQLHVTHHLEEIPSLVTHALLLRRGRAIASGPIERVITSETLTEAFGVPCEVTSEPDHRGRRFRLRVAGR